MCVVYGIKTNNDVMLKKYISRQLYLRRNERLAEGYEIESKFITGSINQYTIT